jgi:murein L,D-transpeptidase YafK
MIYSFRMHFLPTAAQLKRRLACGGLFVLCAFAVAAFGGNRSDSPAPKTEKADSILILKKDHTMELLAGGKVIRSYKVALGRGGLAAKEREGDARTPEGHYIIDAKFERSSYHKALHVSYPSAEDRKRAVSLGVRPGVPS